MRAVVERVTRASIRTSWEMVTSMGMGLLVLLGVGKNDAEADAVYLAEKILNLRIFPGPGGDMDISCLDGGDLSVMVVSEFTLYGDCRKGRRPSFSNAADPLRAEELYDYFISLIKDRIGVVCVGRFRTMMEVERINFGPVTILLDSKKEF
jgi:D-tyrosyl-tRNA(Tyr) deacylase